jgi:hypothetical protein
MKWIKGFLIFGMVMLAHTTISTNEVEAAKTEKTSKKDKKTGKTEKKHKMKKAPKDAKGKRDFKEKEEKSKKKSLFSSFTAGLKKIGSKVADGAKKAGHGFTAGAKALKDKASSAAACRHGKGDGAGKKLYAMASTGTALTDTHVVAAHTTAAAPKAGRKK